MGVSAIIEPVGGSGDRATGAGGLSVGLSAEGETPAQALDRLTDLVRGRLDAGASLTELSVGPAGAPWQDDAGYLCDDPSYQAWRDAMAEYRRRLDDDPTAP